MNRAKLNRFLFHPATVLFTALVAAALFALLIVNRTDGEQEYFLLYYVVPIGIPFVAYLFDRAEHARSADRYSWLIDVAVVVPALIRAVGLIPYVSGHALFLAYAALSTRSNAARVSAGLIFLQVVYLKLVWGDLVTLMGGTLVGGAAAFMYRRSLPNAVPVQTAD